MKNILLILAHPNLAESNINRYLLEAADWGQSVVVNDLYRQYPTFQIDMAREQQLLQQAEVVILQFPFYWYSSPALLKEWQDKVLTRGFAYGPGGNALRGKKLQLVVTSGGGETEYRAGGINQFTYSELLRLLQATAGMLGMLYQPPLCIGDVYELDDAGLKQQAERYRQTVIGLAEA